MKKLTIIPIILILVIGLTYLTLAVTKTGKFQIGNEPPVASNFQVQDGPTPDWDSNPRTTHDITPAFQWDLTDPNPDDITTRICISDELAYQADPCSDPTPILDYTTAANGYQYTLVSALPWPSCGASDIYYISLTPNDGTTDGTPLVSDFTIINSVPNTPSNLIMTPEITPATTPRSTHSQIPSLIWTATDQDSGAVDGWPADTPDHSILIGDICGESQYLNILTGANPIIGHTTSTIPWGPISLGVSTKDFCTRLSITDDAGCTASLDTDFQLIDNIPDPTPAVATVKISDDLADMRTCDVPGAASPCWIIPLTGDYQDVNLEVTFTDSDDDCSNINHDVQLVLKYPDQGPSYPAKDFIYDLTYDSGTTTCVFKGTFIGVDGIEFFRQTPATDYNIEVTITSQAGSLNPGVFGWDYTELKAIKYSDIFTGIEDAVIDLGDPTTCTSGEDVTGYGADGISLDEWNPGLCLERITNWGNQLLTLEWQATDPRNMNPPYTCPETTPDCCLAGSTTECWDLTTDINRFWIDDDNDQVAEAGPLTPVDLPEEPASPAAQFQPSGGLNICNVDTCDDLSLDETLDTYFHIMPPSLNPGDYETSITIGLV